MNTTTVADEICTPYNTLPVPDDEAASRWLYTNTAGIVAKFLVPLVLALGLAGNGAFLFMVARLSRMKTMVNFLLVNLAITDIIFLITQPTFFMYSYFASPLVGHPFDTVGSCVIFYFIGYLSYYCSLSLITLISVERFLAVCHPFRYSQMQKKRHKLMALCVSYMVGLTLAVVTLLKRVELVEFCLQWPATERYENVPREFRYCGPLRGIKNIEISAEIMFAVIFVLAALFNGILYIKIIVAVSSGSITGSNTAEAENVSNRNQIARTLVINGIVFFITQTPIRVNDVNEILDLYNKPQFFTPTQKINFLAFSLLFLFLNSALNPYIYAFSSSIYRNGFLEAFGFRTSKIFAKGSVQSISNNIETTKI